MSHVLNYDGRFFRVDITEVASLDEPGKTVYVGWCSDAFKDLTEMPRHSCSQYIGGAPLPKYADALRNAHDWIKKNWDGQKIKQPIKTRASEASVLYTVWIFKGDSAFGCDFEEFTDAKSFANLAEKSIDVTKVGVKNNESPQFLTVWERS
jgi:hypothetical protein